MSQPARRDARGRFVTDAQLADGLANVVSGAGTTVDKRSYNFYTQPYMLPEQIEAAYRSSWFVQKGVDLPPFDMTRGRRDWQLDEGDVAKIEKEEKRLQVWDKLRQALTLGRLGGGLLIMGVGSNPSTPIDGETVSLAGLKYLHVMNRWQVSVGPIVTDPADPLFCQPSYFRINFGKLGTQQVTIHPSRVIAFRGKLRPNLRGTSGDDWFWGDSVLVAASDAVKNADVAMNGFASLIEEAKVDTVTIPGLTQLVATTEGEALLQKRISVANLAKSNHNTRILDGGRGKDSPGEEWDTRQVTWAGMPEMIRIYAAAVAGAFDIPATRFLGKSPDGMNASGDGDEANYIAKIRAEQDAYLRPALDQLDAVLLPSAGVTVSDEAWYEFPPLKEMSEIDRSTIFKNRMEGLATLDSLAVIPRIAFEKSMQHTAVEEQWLSGLDGALAEVPDDERFPAESEPAIDDPTAGEQLVPPSRPGGLPAFQQPKQAPVATKRAANDSRFKDAAPKTLYVSRRLLNAADLIAWAKRQGFETTMPADQMNVTICYSRTALDWMKIGQDWSSDKDGNLTVPAGGPRIVQKLGVEGAIVLLFASSDLTWRHQAFIDAGASFDFDQYQPHVTITYDAPADFDPSTVEAYTGPLKFGPELFAEVKEGWSSGIEEE
jgi:phage-related protein (TIGR01555 family)